MTQPSPRGVATERWHVHRGARIETRLGLLWEARVTMPGAPWATPVILHSSPSAGIEGVLAQARALVDQRITAGMTIMLRRTPVGPDDGCPPGTCQVLTGHGRGR